MDTPIFIVFNFYALFLLVGGMSALVLQFIDDRRRKREGQLNPLEPWHLKWSDALLIGWGIITAILVLVLALAHAIGHLPDESQQLAAHALGFQLGLLLLLIALFNFYPVQFNLKLNQLKTSILSTIKQAGVQFLAMMILVIPVNLLWRGALNLIEKLGYGSYAKEQDIISILSDYASMPVWLLVLLLVTVVVIAPIAEEILFRGLLYRFLKGRFNPRWAMVASSLTFGIIHFNMASFIPLIFVGMMLTRAYERSGNIKVPILMHAFFNANAMLIIFATPYLKAAEAQFFSR